MHISQDVRKVRPCRIVQDSKAYSGSSLTQPGNCPTGSFSIAYWTLPLLLGYLEFTSGLSLLISGLSLGYLWATSLYLWTISADRWAVSGLS